MKVSLDGLRKNLTNDLNDLAKTISSLTHQLSIDDFEELQEKYNEVAQDIGMLNCCYYEDDPMCTNLANLEVTRI